MISVVLVEPENAGNVGAVARAMANFGFEDLVLVRPKCRHMGKEALDRAKHAKDILQKARVVKAPQGFDYYIGTTSQLGTDYNIPRSPLNVGRLSSVLKGRIRRKIAVVFGPEGKGLSNADILGCDFVVTIPADKNYPTLNLSHSVAIVLYELRNAFGKKKAGGHIIPISEAEKKQLLKMVDRILDKMEFATASKKKTQQVVWKRIIGKSFLTKREAYALMGFFKKIV